MRIAILGAGFTGLSAAYYLSKKGHSVTVFEKDSSPGGLAIGFKEKGWDYTLEKHYHHWFTNDSDVLNLAKEINHKVIIKRPITSVLINGDIYQLDSPKKLLLFPKLNFLERFRMAISLGLLRYNPIWKPLERAKATEFLERAMGKRAFEMIWLPQLKNKFGDYFKEISLAWFWARIKKRTSSLAYPEGGFLEFAKSLESRVKSQGGEFYYNSEVSSLRATEGSVAIYINKSIQKFDKVIVTLPTYLFLKITPDLTDEYKDSLTKLKGLGAINLVLRLKEPFLKDNTYWLSICDLDSPIMAIVEHTNFINSKHYNDEHIVYLGNYLPSDHPNFQKTPEQLLKLYDPFLRKINPSYHFSLITYHLFQAPFAQPIIPINYSKIKPKITTPLKNVYLANMEMVYPWDRGTNYAVELGKKVSDLI